jgi:hypothetical protein
VREVLQGHVDAPSLFERDQTIELIWEKDSIKLKTLVSAVVDFSMTHDHRAGRHAHVVHYQRWLEGGTSGASLRSRGT